MKAYETVMFQRAEEKYIYFTFNDFPDFLLTLQMAHHIKIH